MRKWILAALTFLLFACTLGQPPSNPNAAVPTNASTSISTATVPAAISGNVPVPTAAVTQAQPTPTVTPPPPNPAYPLLTAHIQAIQVSDDNGKRSADITPLQVEQWVNKANEIFAHASIRFTYDPMMDFAAVQSTLLNKMIGDTDSNWTQEVDFGNQAAARYPGKLVVFFRNGPGNGKDSGGFAWSDYNFAAMPGFGTSVCGYQNIGALAHELGHYLGLAHPFPQTFNSIQEAETYLSAHGNDPEAFDGDGLSDTPPDPFIDTPQFQCNPAVQSVTLNKQVFQLPRQNVMSYYSNGPAVDRTELTPEQSSIVRWLLDLRAKNGMATPTDKNIPGAVEFASLAVAAKSGMDSSVQDMSPWSTFLWTGNRQLFCSGMRGSTIQFSISVAAMGKYDLHLYATTAPDYGKIQALIDGAPVGAPLDLYGLLVLPTGSVSVGTIDLTAGTHTLGFRVVGNNTASSGTSFGLSEFTLVAH